VRAKHDHLEPSHEMFILRHLCVIRRALRLLWLIYE